MPEVVFLDIKMPGMSGIDVAKQIAGQSRIVFITAYDQYAVQAFENEAIDYILKPVTAPRLEKTIERLENHFNHSSDIVDLYGKIENIIKVLENSSPREHLKLIRVKTGSQINFIPASKVVFFKAEEKYTIVRTSEKEYLINTPIKELEHPTGP